MEAKEVIEVIELAVQYIKEYKKSRDLKVIKLKILSKKSSINESFAKKGLKKIASDEESILEESIELIKEAYMVGQSGQPCPRCGGTGRV
jgi:hypothetical protein